jgi:hypothetical protein
MKMIRIMNDIVFRRGRYSDPRKISNAYSSSSPFPAGDG